MNHRDESKEHKGWWLQDSFRVLSVGIADTTENNLNGCFHFCQLSLSKALTSHPSDARFCSHKLAKLLFFVCIRCDSSHGSKHRNNWSQYPVTSTLFPVVSHRLATSTGTQSFTRETLEYPVGVSKPESNDTVPLESNPVEHPV